MPRQSSRPPSHLSRHPVALTALAVVLALGPTACGSDDDASPPSTTSGPPATTLEPDTTVGSTVPPPRALLDDQTAPQTINGLVVDGDTLWIASIADDLVLQVDRESGAILARFPGGGAGPDDVAVAPDGTVYSTGFLNGDVGRIADGEYSVLVTLVSGINPITVGDDGTIWVGEMADGGDLTRIEPDGTTEVVATGLPTINGFALDAEGRILAPAGGMQAGEAGGTIVRIDPADGSVTTVADGLPPVLASATDADGRYLALANVSGQVLLVDPEAGTFEVLHTITEGAPFDNLDVAPDGTIYLSSFVAPTVTEVKPDGTVRVIPIGELPVQG